MGYRKSYAMVLPRIMRYPHCLTCQWPNDMVTYVGESASMQFCYKLPVEADIVSEQCSARPILSIGSGMSCGLEAVQRQRQGTELLSD
jgi:hypothetical protein